MKKNTKHNLSTVFRNIFEQEEKDQSSDSEEKEPEEQSEPEEETEDVDSDDTERLKSSIDAELDRVLGDFEADARKSAAINSKKEKTYTESLKNTYYKKLWESAASDIDINVFASNISRLVKNYDNLLDIETIILNKAYKYIGDLYGQNTVKQLKDVLEQQFDLEIERNEIEVDQPEIPIAVGARNTSA